MESAENLQQKVDRLAGLLQACHLITSERNFDALLELITIEACKVLQADRGSIFLYDKKRGVLWSKASKDIDGTIEFEWDKGIAGHVMKTRRAVIIDDVYRDPNFNAEIDMQTGYKTRNMICVPLMTMKNEILGAFEILNKRGGHFNRDDENLLLALATQAASAIENSRFYHELENTRQRLARELNDRFGFEHIIGASQELRRILDLARRVAPSTVNLLITGESGTGKDLLAKTIHYNSGRSGKAFIPLNCAALPESLLEAELFGIERGIATGVDRREGKIEMAHGGTLFLDEIGDMSAVIQSKMLRVLQDKEVTRVGGKKTLKVDVRLIAATNKDLAEEIKSGRFREDLYYRINVVHLHLPPLRKRGEDIPLLINKLLALVCEREGKEIKGFSREALRIMVAYRWPGNIRQLQNEIERAVALTPAGEIVQAEDLSIYSEAQFDRMARLSKSGSLQDVIDRLEREMIMDALRTHKGNKVRTAEALNISREGLRKKMKRLAILEPGDE